MKFAAYPVRRVQTSQFGNPMMSAMVTLNSFAAFADDSGIPVARYQRGGDIYASVSHTYGVNVADQVAAAAANGDRAAISDILGGAATGVSQLDGSTASIFGDQIMNDPLGAPIEAVNKALVGAGKAVGDSTGIKTALYIAGGIGAILLLLKADKIIMR